MTRLVVDASVALRWCFGDGKPMDLDVARSVLERVQSGDQMIVPAIWPLEIANVLLRAEKARQLTARRRTRFLEQLAGLGVVVDEDGVRRAFSHTLALAEEQGLAPYDASYLELALHERLPLASLDAALRRAAGLSGVALFRSGHEVHDG